MFRNKLLLSSEHLRDSKVPFLPSEIGQNQCHPFFEYTLLTGSKETQPHFVNRVHFPLQIGTPRGYTALVSHFRISL